MGVREIRSACATLCLLCALDIFFFLSLFSLLLFSPPRVLRARPVRRMRRARVTYIYRYTASDRGKEEEEEEVPRYPRKRVRSAR